MGFYSGNLNATFTLPAVLNLPATVIKLALLCDVIFLLQYFSAINNAPAPESSKALNITVSDP
eukprot:5374811-Ditylum_brightwellii.AAC.1